MLVCVPYATPPVKLLDGSCVAVTLLFCGACLSQTAAPIGACGWKNKGDQQLTAMRDGDGGIFGCMMANASGKFIDDAMQLPLKCATLWANCVP